jgi:PPK2 family polyphosphate:nucleotide phosphotransferase
MWDREAWIPCNVVLPARSVWHVIDGIRIAPGAKPHIARRDPRDDLGYEDKQTASTRLDELKHRLEMLQQRLFAEGRHSVLLVLQGLDASGKDGVIRSVFEGVNPQSCRVVSFKAPVGAELGHDYLWRVHAVCPARGEIGIFNRSHYEDVVTVRMLKLAPEEVWRRRPAHIVEWERMLTDEGTSIVKVFLNVSKDEQRKRFEERLANPEKRWKFRLGDLDVRAHFDDYISAYEEVIKQTSSKHAPWHVVPADRNWVKATAVAELLVDTLERIDPQLPEPVEGLDGIVIT